MYYPIVDKLKEVINNITAIKEKEPLVIEGTVTSQTGGIWVGNWNDIVSAFDINKPVYVSITISGNKFLIPVIGLHSTSAESGIAYFNQMMTYGQFADDNTFYLVPIQ